MNSGDPQDDPMLRFAAMVEAYLDGRFDTQQTAAFSDELAQSPAKRALFRELCVQHQMLHAMHRASAVRFLDPTLGSQVDSALDPSATVARDSEYLLAELAEMEDRAPVGDLVDITARLATPKPQPRRQAATDHLATGPRVLVIPRALIYSGIAAILLLGIWLGLGLRSDQSASDPQQAGVEHKQPTEAPPPLVLATLGPAVDGGFIDERGQPAGPELIQGRYELKGGLAELTLRSGARVVVQGPATIRLDGTNAMSLDFGQLVAEVPPPAWGFTVDTPAARVVDYGTVFGVRADVSKTTEVHVFEGEVRAAARQADGTVFPAVSLTQSQAARIDGDQGRVEPIQFTATGFEPRVVKRLDLIDIVAGGDGTGPRREIGLNPMTGGYLNRLQGQREFVGLHSDGQARRVPGSAMVARVFVPGATPPIGLPEGLTLEDLASASGEGYGAIWCGGPMPILNQANSTEVPINVEALPFAEHRATIVMHANVGLIIDLDAIRLRYPGFRISRVTMAVANTSERVELDDLKDYRSTFQIHLGNRLAAQADFRRSDNIERQVRHLDCPVGDEDHYLTLVSADGGDAIFRDWLVVGQPLIELQPTGLNDQTQSIP